METLSDMLSTGFEKQANPWKWGLQGASLIGGKLAGWGGKALSGLKHWIKGGKVVGKNIGPQLPTKNLASRTGTALWDGTKKLAREKKLDTALYLGAPLAVHHYVTNPAMKEQEATLEKQKKDLQQLQDTNIALARHVEGRTNQFNQQLGQFNQNNQQMQAEQQRTAQNRGLGGMAGAGIGATLGNLLSQGLGFNKDIGTALGTAAGAYLGSSYGPQAASYLSNKWSQYGQPAYNQAGNYASNMYNQASNYFGGW